MSNDTNIPLEGFSPESLEAFSELSEREIRARAITLIAVLEHLKLNIKESEENNNYRRREAIRSQIAIGKISSLLVIAERNLENILDTTKS